jgi:hypothetical protein
MMLLPDVWRKLKLLSDDSTEHLQRSLTIFWAQYLPEVMQGYPLARPRFRRKKISSCLSRMTFLLESCGDRPHTNLRASKMRKQTITGIWAKCQSGLLGASYVCCFWGEQKHLDAFLQAYAVEKAKIEARRKGHSVTEQSLADGSIKLIVRVGGAT